jgi:sugar/nucleoside kinase (ribokinase family)
VVLKRGPSGVLGVGPDGRTVELEAPAVRAIDTTGAGDSLAAGLLAELAAGVDMEEALRTGVRVASTVVGRDSHQRYPSRKDLLPA